MNPKPDYLMEDEEEALRLDVKTDPEVVRAHARWAGIRAGMRVADLGCGSGKTTFCLHELAQPDGESLGLDLARQRIDFARGNYHAEGLTFQSGDIRQPLEPYGQFDFIWIRFVLEYYRSTAFDILGNVCRILKPGGILCLIDLDHNCLSHDELPEPLESALFGIMNALESTADFDAYAGRKLYRYLYDLQLQQIEVRMDPHHLIYGPLKPSDAFNWQKKIEVAARNSGYAFAEFDGGFEEFREQFKRFFSDPRRFTYTPVMVCRGIKTE